MEDKQVQAPKRGRAMKLLVIGTAVTTALAGSALAADAGFDLAPVTAATGTVATLMTNVLTMITSNPLLVLFLAVGLLGVGITAFKKLKSAAK